MNPEEFINISATTKDEMREIYSVISMMERASYHFNPELAIALFDGLEHMIIDNLITSYIVGYDRNFMRWWASLDTVNKTVFVYNIMYSDNYLIKNKVREL